MTPIEKRYLLFLSPRTPRPKSCARPGKVVLQRMVDAGWIALTGNKRDRYECHITDLGERALDAQSIRLAAVKWRPITTIPAGQTVLITDGDMVRTGVYIPEQDAIQAGLLTSVKLWTWWAAYPSPPKESRT